MGIVRFEIELDNPAKTYTTGSIVSGKVYLDLDSPKSVEGLKVTIYGRGKISFRRGKHQVRGKEIYIDEDKYFLGPDGPVVIPRGNHVYTFNYVLPEKIPNTYEDRIGTIKYRVIATIRKPWYICNDRTSTDFAVVTPLDLNSNDCNAAEAVRENISQTFMGCSHPVHMTVSLPVRGYVPGETMPIMVYLKNEAEVRIKGIYFSLTKVNLYHAKYERTRRNETLLIDQVISIPETDDIETRIQNRLQIPLVQPSLIHSRVIDIGYLLRVEVRVGGLHFNFGIDIPIIIGNIALLASTVAKDNEGVPMKY